MPGRKALADKPAEDFPPADDVVFLKIDPETGLLAREGNANAIADVFRKGTEPTQYADTAKKSEANFYSLDQGGEADAPKKNEEEEVTD